MQIQEIKAMSQKGRQRGGTVLCVLGERILLVHEHRSNGEPHRLGLICIIFNTAEPLVSSLTEFPCCAQSVCTALDRMVLGQSLQSPALQ